MSVSHAGSAGLQAAAAFELQQHQGAQAGALEALCGGLLDLQGLQGAATAPNSPYAAAAAAVASNLPGSTPSIGCLLGRPAAHQQDALTQLLVLQEQQQLAAALEAEPLVSLGNLLAAQQGLNARVQELLLLKQQLAAAVPSQRSGHSGIRGTGPIANPLYKTELCRSWEETGSCRYGAKCQFAHGREELRPVVRHPKYKTEVCRTFAQSGTCPYGTRCRFIHTSASTPGTNSPTVGAGRGGSATPSAGSTPVTPTPSRVTSFSSLSGATTAPSRASFTLTPYPPPSPAPASYGLSDAALLAAHDPAAAAAAAAAASMLGLQSVAASGLHTSGLGNPAAGIGLSNAYSPATTGPSQVVGVSAGAGASASTLATLAALLNSAASAAPNPAPPPPLTAAAALAGSHPLLGVVGPPAGLAPIGPFGAAAGVTGSVHCVPSCPATPVGTASVAAMRRSISDSGSSTPNGSAKRLPIFEQLIPDANTALDGTAGNGL